jgi:hypothetical protein
VSRVALAPKGVTECRQDCPRFSRVAFRIHCATSPGEVLEARSLFCYLVPGPVAVTHSRPGAPGFGALEPSSSSHSTLQINCASRAKRAAVRFMRQRGLCIGLQSSASEVSRWGALQYRPPNVPCADPPAASMTQPGCPIPELPSSTHWTHAVAPRSHLPG